jgi:flagellar biogenesis protein FliO
MSPARSIGICRQAVTRLLKRKRALIGLGVLASLFVILSLISPAATGQAGGGRAAAGGTQEEPSGEVQGAGREGAETPSEVPTPGIGSMAVKVVGSVLLLIGILYGGMYAMRVLSGRTGRGGFSCEAISVLHKTHIAPKKAIYVLKVGEKAMVVGVTDSQINHLSDLSEEELGSLKAPEKPGPKGRSFKQHLMGLALGGKERA